MTRLSRATCPAYRPSRTGIVHLGIGAFHRAHQAVYTEDAMRLSGDSRWGICGVSMRTDAVVRRLAPQDGLYSVVVDGEPCVIGSVREVLFARASPAALTARIASPDTHVITLTITEKGYAAGDPGNSAVDLLVAGLRARAAAGTGPVTVISCDNLPGNGTVLARLIASRDESLLSHATFPSSTVDRIVPATTPADLDEVERRLGLRDEGAVVTEPFTQWVIEDAFAGQRPDWEAAGALLVRDVEPYERLKLRLLNGSHSAMACLGGLAGKEHVADVVTDPVFARYVRRLMDEDLTPTVSTPDGFDLGRYQASLLVRFANPVLRHRTAQIATDGSRKLPPRLLEPARELLRSGRKPRWIALAVAAWMRYVTVGRADDGTVLPLDDPLAGRLGGWPPEVFGDDLPRNRVFRDLVDDFSARLAEHGVAATVRSEAWS